MAHLAMSLASLKSAHRLWQRGTECLKQNLERYVTCSFHPQIYLKCENILEIYFIYLENNTVYMTTQIAATINNSNNNNINNN